MPTWAKVVLVVVLIGFAVMVAGLFFAGRWLRTRFDEFGEAGKVAIDEGKRFGEGRDAEACVVESLARLKQCSGFGCEIRTKIFMSSCLETATTPPGYCDKIPSQAQIVESPRWQYDECGRRGWGLNERCTRVISTLQDHCAGLRK